MENEKPDPVNVDDHDRGLEFDMMTMAPKLMARRKVLSLLGVAGGAALLAACSNGGTSSDTTTSTDSTSGGSSGSSGSGSSGTDTCVADPQETGGPYPGDGSNSVNGSTVNVLAESGVVRSDITSSFGGLTGIAEGVPVTLTITVVNVNNSCSALEGYALYLWHATKDGEYSLYSSGIQDENYLRGVQVSDANGQIVFKTIWPGCYDGRWPHTHFEVYGSLDDASTYRNAVLTSQMAMPSDTCSAVYSNASGYSDSVSNFNRISISSDNVFGDNSSAEITAMTPVVVSGNYEDGYELSITVGLAL